MPRIVTMLGVVLGLCFLAVASGWTKSPPHYSQLTFPELSDWPHVEPQTSSLPNKARLVVIQDHELPLVQITVVVRTGEVLVPQGLEGLGQIMGEALRSGGSETYSPNELNSLLENKAADLSVSVDLESVQVKLNILREDLQSLLPVLSDLLAHPRFPEDKIALAKKQVLTEIARRNDNQQKVAFREFQRLVYGPETVYGRLPQVETVHRIERKDILRLYQQGFTGSNMLIGVVGDVQPEEIKNVMTESLGSIPTGERTELDFPALKISKHSKHTFIDMTGVNQVSILMGHEGGLRQDEDYAALQVMNSILSQGFNSRLFQTLRTRMGLAYSVYGRYGSNVFYPGVFLAGLKTKNTNMLRAVQALKKEIVALHEDGVTKEEVQRAKEEFLNSLVFRYETPAEILDRQLHYAYRDMPLDSFEKLVQEIKEVRVQDVNRAAAQHLHPDRLQMLMVGNRDMVQEQLTEFPDLEVVELEE
ncbi:MAG: pitrilysin family protein [Desulfovermiculus sp.]|nr:pitrilysin family protein [Desulfovermiculus sp.]